MPLKTRKVLVFLLLHVLFFLLYLCFSLLHRPFSSSSSFSTLFSHGIEPKPTFLNHPKSLKNLALYKISIVFDKGYSLDFEIFCFYMDPRTRLALLGLLSFLALVLSVSGNLVFPVHNKFKGKERSLSALKDHDARRHRRILSAVDLELGGNGLPSETGLVFFLFCNIYLYVYFENFNIVSILVLVI